MGQHPHHTRRRRSIILDAGYVSIRRNDSSSSSIFVGLHGKKLICLITATLILFLASLLNLTVSPSILSDEEHLDDMDSVWCGLCTNWIGHPFMVTMVRRSFDSIAWHNSWSFTNKEHFKNRSIRPTSKVHRRSIAHRKSRFDRGMTYPSEENRPLLDGHLRRSQFHSLGWESSLHEYRILLVEKSTVSRFQ